MLACMACACTPLTPRVIPTLVSIQFTPENDLNYQSSGGGEPRSTGYWLIWNSCSDGNQSETARANGGREAGWIIMDDLLDDPGVLIGMLGVQTCDQGMKLLQSMNLQGVEMKTDPAYVLASQLMAALLNMAAGSEYCPASDSTVNEAQKLLLGLNFNGTGLYLGPPSANTNVERAQELSEQLAKYNTGSLCIP
jgi:hypothetical protein